MRYRITLQEKHTIELNDWFDGVDVSQGRTGRTVLTGEFLDQAALVSFLLRLQHLNFTLLSVTRQSSGRRTRSSGASRTRGE